MTWLFRAGTRRNGDCSYPIRTALVGSVLASHDSNGNAEDDDWGDTAVQVWALEDVTSEGKIGRGLQSSLQACELL